MEVFFVEAKTCGLMRRRRAKGERGNVFFVIFFGGEREGVTSMCFGGGF